MEKAPNSATIGMLLVAAACVAPSPVARADEFPFSGSAESEFKKGFDKDAGISDTEKTGTEQDRLKLGGTLLSEFWYFDFSGMAYGNSLVQPNSLWGYGDANLRNDVRAFVKARLIFDPTANPALISPLTGNPEQKTQSVLEELKLMFDAGRKAFFTIGKQKIKWGSARFWNPTDFVNTVRRPLLRPEDEREGVTLIKTHVPVRSSNFYLIQILDDASKIEDVGLAARAEVASRSGEFALSAAGKKGRRPSIGADASFGLWDLDVYSEVSYSKGSDLTFYRFVDPMIYGVPIQAYQDTSSGFMSTSSGVSYEFKYDDTDTMTLGFEYFFNAQGYGDKSQYGAVVASGAYRPFYLGKNYGLFSVNLPQPGHNKNLSFNLYNIVNFDGSATTRLDTYLTYLQDILWTWIVAVDYGNPGGEFKLGGQVLNVATTFRVNF